MAGLRRKWQIKGVPDPDDLDPAMKGTSADIG